MQLNKPNFLPERDVRIACVINSQASSGELVITVQAGERSYEAIARPGLVDTESSPPTIPARVVAEWNGDLLVDLPVDTLTAGSRIRVSKDVVMEIEKSSTV